MTGEGFADVAALKAANVGFAMGSGVPAAKAAAKVILINDDISSIINAVLWGRNIYCNARKYLQFQITFNLTIIIIVFIGAIFSGATLFSPIQLLYMNLIMDTFAAIALSAEEPRPEAIQEKPVTASEDILSKTMSKHIVFMTLWISLVMFFMFWFNEKFWGFTYEMEEDMFSSGDPTNKCRAFTMLFNIFIWMHLFNLINCRHLTEKGLVPFKALFTNNLFLFILGGIVTFHLLMIEYGGVLARTSGLSKKQHCLSIMLGASTLIANYVLKKVPEAVSNLLVIG